MTVTSALILQNSFARTAMEKLAEENYPDEEGRKKVLTLYDTAQSTAAAKIAKHLPAIDPEHSTEILETLRLPTAQSRFGDNTNKPR